MGRGRSSRRPGPPADSAAGAPALVASAADIRDWVLADLEKNQVQTSWDWEADMRLARAMGDTETAETLRQVMGSAATLVTRDAAHAACAGRIRARRMRALAELTRQGLLQASWVGTGPGGGNELGVTRIRCWSPW